MNKPKDTGWENFEDMIQVNMVTSDEAKKTTAVSVDITSSALTKAEELIKISQATDVSTLIAQMREKFVVNRVESATKGEAAVNLTLSKLIDKLNTEDMPVNTLLKILTQLRDSSVQDMSALLGAPNTDPRKGGGSQGTVVQIMNTNSPQSQPSMIHPQHSTDASSDITKFLEASTLALSNIKNGTVQIQDAEYTEEENNG